MLWRRDDVFAPAPPAEARELRLSVLTIEWLSYARDQVAPAWLEACPDRREQPRPVLVPDDRLQAVAVDDQVVALLRLRLDERADVLHREADVEAALGREAPGQLDGPRDQVDRVDAEAAGGQEARPRPRAAAVLEHVGFGRVEPQRRERVLQERPARELVEAGPAAQVVPAGLALALRCSRARMAAHAGHVR
jgi:hypothetical protein